MFFSKLKATLATGMALVLGMGTLVHCASGLTGPPVNAEIDKLPADVREMVGTWTMTTTETVIASGKPLPPREKKVTFVISEDRIISRDDNELIPDEELTFTVDPNQAPKTIDMVCPRVGAFSGIYQLVGDSLKICFSPEVGKRPTKVPAKTDLSNGAILWDLKRVSRTPMKVTPRFPNAPGCFWMVEPRGSPPSLLGALGLVFSYEKDRDGAALITLAGALPGSRPPDYRPVLLDAGKKRYLPESIERCGSGRRDGVVVTLSRWRMDPKVLPAEKVAHIGIEELTPEVPRAAAREALEKARQEGVEVIPYPEVGKPFDFTLTTLDGKRVRAQDLRGKVVVIDCWATWCSPCMALLPEIKELYQKRHKDGLEVIGVNFDNLPETVKKTCQRLALEWPQVMLPSDDKKRKLWHKASGISAIPRLLVIDRNGILRADNPRNLDQEVGKLLKNTPGVTSDRALERRGVAAGLGQ